jgi:hypothetical protein
MLIIAGTLGLVLATSGASAAEQRDSMWSRMGGMGGMAMRMSPEDLGAFQDAYIAALHAGLKLSADQERLWPPVEQALRNVAQVHLAHMQAMRQNRGRMAEDPIGLLRTMADTMSQGADAVRRLADAAAPLYATLDDGQKDRLRILTRGMGMARMMGPGGGSRMRDRWLEDQDDDR